MGLVQRLATAGTIEADWRGPIALLTRDDALVVVQIAAREGVRILGIEGFAVAGQSIRPSLDSILDLSESRQVESSGADAERFLRRAPRDLRYEIELSEEPAGGDS